MGVCAGWGSAEGYTLPFGGSVRCVEETEVISGFLAATGASYQVWWLLLRLSPGVWLLLRLSPGVWLLLRLIPPVCLTLLCFPPGLRLLS